MHKITRTDIKYGQHSPKDKICCNCAHFFSGIGVGMGIRCKHKKQKDSNLDSKPKGMIPLLKSRTSTCDLFEKRSYQNSPELDTSNTKKPRLSEK